MSRDINPFGLRMPEDLKQRIEEMAVKQRRSLNAEIVARLEWSLEQDGAVDRSVGDLSAILQEHADIKRIVNGQAIFIAYIATAIDALRDPKMKGELRNLLADAKVHAEELKKMIAHALETFNDVKP